MLRVLPYLMLVTSVAGVSSSSHEDSVVRGEVRTHHETSSPKTHKVKSIIRKEEQSESRASLLVNEHQSTSLLPHVVANGTHNASYVSLLQGGEDPPEEAPESECKSMDTSHPKPIAAIFSIDHSGSVGSPGWDVFSTFVDILGSVILNNSVSEDYLNGIVFGQWGHPRTVDVCPGLEMTKLETSEEKFADCMSKTGRKSNPKLAPCKRDPKDEISPHTNCHTIIMNPKQKKKVYSMTEGTTETIAAMKIINPVFKDDDGLDSTNYSCWLILMSDCGQGTGSECAPSKPLVLEMMKPPYNCTVFGAHFGGSKDNGAHNMMKTMASDDGEGGKLAYHFDNFAQLKAAIGSKSEPKGVAKAVATCATEMRQVMLKKLETTTPVPEAKAWRMHDISSSILVLLLSLTLMRPQ